MVASNTDHTAATIVTVKQELFSGPPNFFCNNCHWYTVGKQQPAASHWRQRWLFAFNAWKVILLNSAMAPL